MGKNVSVSYESYTPVTLKQGQQTWKVLVDPKKVAKFGKHCFNSVSEKANDKVLVKSGNISYLPWICAEVKNSVYSWPAWCT